MHTVLIVIIFIMGPEGGGPDPHDPLAGSALARLVCFDTLPLHM